MNCSFCGLRDDSDEASLGGTVVFGWVKLMVLVSFSVVKNLPLRMQWYKLTAACSIAISDRSGNNYRAGCDYCKDW